jgi:hypothetical protein
VSERPPQQLEYSSEADTNHARAFVVPPAVAVPLGFACGIAVFFSGVGALACLLMIWVVGPLVVGYIVSRRQVMAATAFNVIAFGVPVVWSVFKGLVPPSPPQRLTVVALLSLLCIVGLAFAQLARLTMPRPR